MTIAALGSGLMLLRARARPLGYATVKIAPATNNNDIYENTTTTTNNNLRTCTNIDGALEERQQCPILGQLLLATLFSPRKQPIFVAFGFHPETKAPPLHFRVANNS